MTTDPQLADTSAGAILVTLAKQPASAERLYAAIRRRTPMTQADVDLDLRELLKYRFIARTTAVAHEDIDQPKKSRTVRSSRGTSVTYTATATGRLAVLTLELASATSSRRAALLRELMLRGLAQMKVVPVEPLIHATRPLVVSTMHEEVVLLLRKPRAASAVVDALPGSTSRQSSTTVYLAIHSMKQHGLVMADTMLGRNAGEVLKEAFEAERAGLDPLPILETAAPPAIYSLTAVGRRLARFVVERRKIERHVDASSRPWKRFIRSMYAILLSEPSSAPEPAPRQRRTRSGMRATA